MPKSNKSARSNTDIRIIGIGGYGCECVRDMFLRGILGVSYLLMDSDVLLMPSFRREGVWVPHRDGAGLDYISSWLHGSDMLVLVCSLDGKAEIGFLKTVCKIANASGPLTVFLAATPSCSIQNETTWVKDGLADLLGKVDMLIPISNLVDTRKGQAFSWGQEACEAGSPYLVAKGMIELITSEGLIGIDLADLREIIRGSGLARAGSGVASGEVRAETAAGAAISHLGLGVEHLAAARSMLVAISASDSLIFREIWQVMEYVKKYLSEQTTFLIGNIFDNQMGETLRVTVIVGGV